MHCFAFYKVADALRQGFLVPECADVLHMFNQRTVTGLYAFMVIVGGACDRACYQGTSYCVRGWTPASPASW